MISPAEQREIEDFCRKLGAGVRDVVRERYGSRILFTLLLSTSGAGGWSTYLSNAEREAMVQLLRELAAKVEADPRKQPREYVREVAVPQRFDLERLADAQLRGQRLQIPELEGGTSLLVSANGRLAGVLVLSGPEERALKDRLYREEGPRTAPAPKPPRGKQRRRRRQ